MKYVRRNVWELGGDWADPILWYARGVRAMKAAGLDKTTAWRFFGAIHGIDKQLWQQDGYWHPTEPMPGAAVEARYWNQCQHGSWYFLPWHRGYLIAFEAVVRDAISKLPKAPTDWALPYWNYFKPHQNRLPPAFASADWPDGRGDNPLYVTQRYGPGNNGKVYVPLSQVNLRALGDPDYAGAASGGSPGFGGVQTGFSHGGSVHGGIETQPHDWVHGLVGGSDPRSNTQGLMSDPDTAALDPIFWLHHANIDRLWQVWRTNPPTDVDPTAKNWLHGPKAIGERAFVQPMPSGVDWTYTPADVSDFAKLNYTYDDVSAPDAASQPAARLMSLGLTAAAAQALARSDVMTGPKTVELLGANQGSLPLVGAEAATSLSIDATVQGRVTSSIERTVAGLTSPPDRVFLNLENVRGLNDATAFDVYIAVPAGADPKQYPDHLAGGIALFGVRKATQTDGEHAGNGLTFVLEISHVMDMLHRTKGAASGQLSVRLIPLRPVTPEAQVSIGRISVFRQSP